MAGEGGSEPFFAMVGRGVRSEWEEIGALVVVVMMILLQVLECTYSRRRVEHAFAARQKTHVQLYSVSLCIPLEEVYSINR